MDSLICPRPAPASRLLALLCVIIVSFGHLHADWQSELTTVRPGPIPLPSPVDAKYHFGWSGLTAGRLTVSLSRVQNQKITLDASGRSVGLARTLWRLDATHHAVANARTLRPLTLDQKEVYSGKTIVTEVRFTGDTLTKTRKVSVDKDPGKPKTLKLPQILDLQTGLLFARSQPLKTGDTLKMAVIPSWSPYLATVKVTGTESITVAAGKFDCIKCDLRLQTINKELELGEHKQFKRATIWISNDDKRLLIKISADIFIGSVFAELDSFQEPKAP